MLRRMEERFCFRKKAKCNYGGILALFLAKVITNLVLYLVFPIVIYTENKNYTNNIFVVVHVWKCMYSYSKHYLVGIVFLELSDANLLIFDLTMVKEG